MSPLLRLGFLSATTVVLCGGAVALLASLAYPRVRAHLVALPPEARARSPPGGMAGVGAPRRSGTWCRRRGASYPSGSVRHLRAVSALLRIAGQGVHEGGPVASTEPLSVTAGLLWPLVLVSAEPWSGSLPSS